MRFATPAWTRSLNLRVLVAFIAGVAMSISALVIVIEGLLQTRGPVLIGEDVADYAQGLAKRMRFDSAGAPMGVHEELAQRTWLFRSLENDLAYRLLDSAGKVVLESPTDPAFWKPAGAARLQQELFEFENQGIKIRVATEPIERNGRTWFLQFGASERLVELFHLEIGLPFMGMGILFFSLTLLLLFSLFAHIALKCMLKPLHAVSASAAAISPHSLHARLLVKNVPTEITPLVESFNRVLERLERGYRVQQEFLATAAHELKTPLALIRAQVEFMAPGEARDALLLDLAHMTRQVQQLLLLAEASEAQNYVFEATDVGELAREAAAYLQRMAQAAGVRIDVLEDATATRWQADRGALFTLLKNLLENAIQHAPPGSTVRVELGPSSLSVRDQGPGVDPAQRALLFQRFWRGAHRRDHGAGLGLSICLEIARAHGWTLDAQAAEPGLCLRVSKAAPG